MTQESGFGCGSRLVGISHPCLIIAEIGVNHEGDVNVAREMLQSAADAGADAVKLQIVETSSLFSHESSNSSFVSLFKQAELSEDEYRSLFELGRELNVEIFASFNSKLGIDLSVKFGAPALKIASTQLTNIPLIRYASLQNKPMILSTGMASLSEIEDALRAAVHHGPRDVILLHCVSNYPTLPEQVNLRVMDTLRSAFSVPVGFSDHCEGLDASLAARALGAVAIERHFSLDPSRSGFDHVVSSDPKELASLVESVRKIERMMGAPKKLDTDYEQVSRTEFRTSLAADVAIPKGVVVTEEMLCGMRPGTGIPTAMMDYFVGKTTQRKIAVGELIDLGDIK